MAEISYSMLHCRLDTAPPKVLSDEKMDTSMEKIVSQFPYAGQKIIQGAFQAEEVPVTCSVVQRSLMRVDLVSSFVRTVARIPRRVGKYWVLFANAIWHFDGYEKLVQYATSKSIYFFSLLTLATVR